MTDPHVSVTEQDADLRTITLTVCNLCLAGVGGECHVPGCAFWMCPAPDDEQAEHMRFGASLHEMAASPSPDPITPTTPGGTR